MQAEHEKKVPTMDELYSKKSGANSFRIGDGEVFVNFNRRLQPFIRVNIYPSKTKTFRFTKRGYDMAIAYLLKAGDSQ